MNKTITVMISMLFALGGLAALTPTGVAQSGEAAVTDPADDAAVFVGHRGVNDAAPPSAAPATVPSTAAGPGDLTGFRVYGESATSLSFELSVASMGRPNTWQPATVYYITCFDWSGTGSTYRFQFQLSFPTTPQSEANSYPRFTLGNIQRVAQCAGYDYDGSIAGVSAQFPHPFFTHELNTDENTLQWTIPRKLLAELHPDFQAEGAMDPVPAVGDTLGGLQAFAISTITASVYSTYDETPTTDFTFQQMGGNEKVKVIIPANIQFGGGFAAMDTPMYGIEIGSFQTIPVIIENHLDTPIEPNITVQMIDGEAGSWDLRTLPSIPVPKMIGETPGRATVTLIVNSEPTISHKQSVRLLVKALDQNQPEHLGAQSVDVVAVEPPTVGSSTLYFHGTGDPCSRFDRWINTLQQDQDAASTGTEIAFQDCTGGGGAATSGDIGHLFRPDVPFARDLTLSTGENAKATIVLRSVQRTPGATAQEVEVPTVVDVKVQILAGTSVIGEAVDEAVELGAAKKTVPIEVPIQGRILGGFGRLVPDESGISLRVSVAPSARIFEAGGCFQGHCTPEYQAQVEQTGGKVFMVLGASKVELPVTASERSGDLINITKSGALMTLRLSEGEKHVFANPGGTKVFNITVRNEGVNVDTAKISARLNQSGWEAEILPVTSYKLKVGEPRSFNLRVTAPPGGIEGQTLLIEVIATSTVDKNAIATLPLRVELTTGEKFEDDRIDDKLQKVDETEESPALSAVLSALAVLALVGIARRRRL